MYIPCTPTPVIDLLPRTSGFDPRSVHVGFEWTKLTLGPDFLRILQFGLVSSPPLPHLFHTHISVIYHGGYATLPTDDVVK